MSDTNLRSVDETRREQFESAWESGKTPVIEENLPTEDDPRFLGTLEELVHLELEYAWRAAWQQANDDQDVAAETLAQPPRVEEYLDRFAQLNDQSIVVRLVKQEFYVRHRYGDRPSSAEYQQRFPDHVTSVDILEKALPEKPLAPKIDGVPDTVDRYRIAGEKGRGGFGVVWQAEDPKLGRKVAVKQLKYRTASNEQIRRRFLNEARITARLEHPGVVPVHDLSTLHSDQPYYTMKLVEGKTLFDVLREFHQEPAANGDRSVEELRLLHAYLSIVRTMQYVHAQEVIHRDLKPSNIILGDFGETVILDWGLAKQLDDADSPMDTSIIDVLGDTKVDETRHGAIQGTPAYMSPEQASGDTKRVDQQSDLFSLGVILYQLLTGHLPFEGRSTPEVLRKVRESRPHRPRTFDSHIAQPMEAICLKAMALNRDERYQSARQLADDVEHYLADEPVTAWQEPWWIRTRRWMRRHQAAVVGISAAIVVALIASIVAAIFLGAARRREESAKREALENYRLATKYFQQARGAVDEFFVHVSEDTLLNQAGMQPLRRKLRELSLKYYQQFLADHCEKQELQREVASAHYHIGLINEEIRTPHEALPSYREARRQQSALLKIQPDDLDRLYALSNTINAIGRALQKIERHGEALAEYLEAFKLRQRLVDKHPKNHEYQRKLANSHMNIGLIQHLQGQKEEAYAKLDLAQNIRLKQLKKHDDIKLQRDLGKGYFDLALFCRDDGETDRAEKYIKLAIGVFEKVVAKDPNDLANQNRLARCYALLGDRVARSEPERGLGLYEQARLQLEVLAARNPNVLEFRARLAAIFMNMGELQRLMKQPQLALESFSAAADLLLLLAEQQPSVPAHRRDYGVSLKKIGEIYLDQGDKRTAADNLNVAKTILAGLASEFPNSEDYKKSLEETQTLLTRADDPAD